MPTPHEILNSDLYATKTKNRNFAKSLVTGDPDSAENRQKVDLFAEAFDEGLPIDPDNPELNLKIKQEWDEFVKENYGKDPTKEEFADTIYSKDELGDDEDFNPFITDSKENLLQNHWVDGDLIDCSFRIPETEKPWKRLPLIQWQVEIGMLIFEGDPVCLLGINENEAFQISSPVTGLVKRKLWTEGDMVEKDETLLQIREQILVERSPDGEIREKAPFPRRYIPIDQDRISK